MCPDRTVFAGLASLLVLVPAAPLPAQLASLPRGAVQQTDWAGVQVEFGLRNLLMPQADVARRLPGHLRPWTVSDLARLRPGLQRFLEHYPDYATAAVTFLGFTLLDSLALDGVTRKGPQAVAFWWVPVVRADDSVAAGGPIGNVELAAWWADPATARDVGKAWPSAAPGSTRLSRQGSVWNWSLKAPDLSIQAACQAPTTLSPVQYPLPAVDTIWAPGQTGRRFELLTYYGHHSGQCDATWRAEGTHPIARALSDLQGRPDWRPVTEVLSGWRARSAVYTR